MCSYKVSHAPVLASLWTQLTYVGRLKMKPQEPTPAWLSWMGTTPSSDSHPSAIGQLVTRERSRATTTFLRSLLIDSRTRSKVARHSLTSRFPMAGCLKTMLIANGRMRWRVIPLMALRTLLAQRIGRPLPRMRRSVPGQHSGRLASLRACAGTAESSG